MAVGVGGEDRGAFVRLCETERLSQHLLVVIAEGDS